MSIITMKCERVWACECASARVQKTTQSFMQFAVAFSFLSPATIYRIYFPFLFVFRCVQCAWLNSFDMLHHLCFGLENRVSSHSVEMSLFAMKQQIKHNQIRFIVCTWKWKSTTFTIFYRDYEFYNDNTILTQY